MYIYRCTHVGCAALHTCAGSRIEVCSSTATSAQPGCNNHYTAAGAATYGMYVYATYITTDVPRSVRTVGAGTAAAAAAASVPDHLILFVWVVCAFEAPCPRSTTPHIRSTQAGRQAGRLLDVLVDKCYPLSSEEATELGQGVCKCVFYIHTSGEST